MKLYDFIYELCNKVSKQRGSIAIVISDGVKSNNKYSGLNILENEKQFKTLAYSGGNFLISEQGILLDYGTQIDLPMDKGLRFFVSKSEEKVFVYLNGEIKVDLDPKSPEVKQKKNLILEIIESIGAGTIGTVGTGILVPTIGLTFFPGLILFGSAYAIGKKLLEKK